MQRRYYSMIRVRMVVFCVYIRTKSGAKCSSVGRAFAHGAMGRWIDPSWWTH